MLNNKRKGVIHEIILVKDLFIFSVLENLTEKHSFVDNRVL